MGISALKIIERNIENSLKNWRKPHKKKNLLIRFLSISWNINNIFENVIFSTILLHLYTVFVDSPWVSIFLQPVLKLWKRKFKKFRKLSFCKNLYIKCSLIWTDVCFSVGTNRLNFFLVTLEVLGLVQTISFC